VRLRAFGLPFVAAGQLIPWVEHRMDAIYRADAWLLRRFPRLAHFAGIRVIELTV
jgi:hypothetical protein